MAVVLESRLKIPKIIWMYWDQGYDQAPAVVKACINSWMIRNPEWRVELLDCRSAHRYLAGDTSWFELENLCLAHRSDLLRLYLLKEYGGVWTDVTTVCMRPLDEWIESVSGSGFFCFDRPGADRPIANWFIAATPHNYLVATLFENLAKYFLENSFGPTTPLKQWMAKRLGKRFNQSLTSTRGWFSWWVRKGLGICPYFIFHYMFSRLALADADFSAIWERTARISADGPHALQRHGLLKPISAPIKSQIDSRISFLYKLDWRKRLESAAPDSVLFYVLNSVMFHAEKNVV